MQTKDSRSFLKRCFKLAVSSLLLSALFGVFTEAHSPPALEALQYPYGEARTRPVWRPFSPVLRVVVPFSDKASGQTSGYGTDMEHELLERFVASGDYKVRHIYAHTCAEGLGLIQKKRADLMVGFGGTPDKRFDKVAEGPSLADFNPVIVTLPKEADLGELYISAVRLNRVNYPEESRSEVMAGQDNAILVDPATHALLIPLHNNLQTVGQAQATSSYHWFWNKDDKALDESMQSFWSSAEVERLRAELVERYYGFMPTAPKQNTLLELARIISSRIGVYSADISRAAAENDIDPLLLSAIIFQESRFDPQARSYTGVRGIMQLTANTANMLNVDRMDPGEAIMGGARYLRAIKDSLEFVQGVSEWDKWYLTLAGFNQGPTVLRRALRAAGGEGLNQNWAAMRGYYGSLQAKGIAGPGFRAKEAVSYVENVRYYYYILSGLAQIARPEHEELAGLLAGLD